MWSTKMSCNHKKFSVILQAHDFTKWLMGQIWPLGCGLPTPDLPSAIIRSHYSCISHSPEHLLYFLVICFWRSIFSWILHQFIWYAYLFVSPSPSLHLHPYGHLASCGQQLYLINLYVVIRKYCTWLSSHFYSR